MEYCQIAMGKKAALLEVFSFNGISYESLLFLTLVHRLQAQVLPFLGAVGIFLMMQCPWIDMNMNTDNWFSEYKIQLSCQEKQSHQ